MRHFVSAVNTETHQLFPTSVRKLSACIFVWDASDLEQLKAAKRNELDAQHVDLQDDQVVMLHKMRRELERHCRRTTRGVDVTTRLIQELIDALDSPAGCDTLQLLDHDKIQEVWAVQQRHIGCIQDIPGYPLYREVETTMKGGIQLKVFRCARGSTSLESSSGPLCPWLVDFLLTISLICFLQS